VPQLAGTYTATIAVAFSNYIELRSDTLRATLVLHDRNYRGQFDGSYQTSFGDEGQFAGAERPEGTLTVTVFGSPPTPIAYVMGLRRLYPWCDFPHLGAGPLSGQRRVDTLLISGRGSVPCFYQISDTALQAGTELRLSIVAVR
jgi:hypothetical protein